MKLFLAKGWFDEENAGHGILVTNAVVSEDVKQYAIERGVELWDRAVLTSYLLQ